MTESELAFLALGLLLGAASGAALSVVLGNRPARREIRVTVTRDAVPRRSGTLSQDAFVTSPGGPAPGGPGDRRSYDRAEVGPVRGDDERPSMPPAPTPPAAPSIRLPDRTPVPSIAVAMPVRPAAAVGIAIEPERDLELERLRVRPARGSALERMLRGEHRAMVEVVDAVAGEDSQQRRAWEVLLGGLVEALADVAVRESVVDFPMGTAFWDTFTVEQCRRIAASLATMGYQYDGVAAWQDSRLPAYRDLTQALADIGVDPRRVRAWPNQSEIASLFSGARPAPEELLAAAGPDYTATQMQALIGERAKELADLWLAWEAVRPLLLDERMPAGAEIPADA